MNKFIKISDRRYPKVSMNIYIDFNGLFTKSAKKHLSNSLMSLPHLK